MYFERNLLVYIMEKDVVNGVFVIPRHIEYIQDYAFSCIKSLRKVVFHSNVKNIKEYAFYNCDNLSIFEFESDIPFSQAKNLLFKNSDFYSKIVVICGSYNEIIINSDMKEYDSKRISLFFTNGHFFQQLSKPKNVGKFEIFKGKLLNKDTIFFISRIGKFIAFGKDVESSMLNCQFEIIKADNPDIFWYAKNVKEKGIMTARDYQRITSACISGVESFLKKHNLTWEDTMTIDEVMDIIRDDTKNRYVHYVFQKALLFY